MWMNAVQWENVSCRIVWGNMFQSHNLDFCKSAPDAILFVWTGISVILKVDLKKKHVGIVNNYFKLRFFKNIFYLDVMQSYSQLSTILLTIVVIITDWTKRENQVDYYIIVTLWLPKVQPCYRGWSVKSNWQHVGAVQLLTPQANRCQWLFDSLDLVQIKKSLCTFGLVYRPSTSRFYRLLPRLWKGCCDIFFATY